MSRTGTIVKSTLSANTHLSEEQLTQLQQLKHRKIDFSDIPPSPVDANWVRCVASEHPGNKSNK
jgi:hypothetical protein